MAGELSDVATSDTIEAAHMNNVKNRTVMRYTNTADRTTKIPTPVEGDIAYMEDTDEVYYYDGSSWDKLGPSDLTAGGGITITGTAPDNTIAHSDTSSVSDVSNPAGTVIEDMTFDTYGHVLTTTSRALDPDDIGAAWPTVYNYDDYTGGGNIGTGLTPVSASLSLPAAGMVKVSWSVMVERTGGTSAATLTILPRNDGANMASSMWASTVELGVLVPAAGDRAWFSGVAYEVFGAADTSTWSLYLSKSGSDSYSCQKAVLVVEGLPA